jgi:hypothetical protein
MKTYVNCTRFTPARGKVTAILIAACLAALSAESAAQPTADPSLAKAWIQEDSNGVRYVFYKPRSGGSPVSAGRLTEPLPLSSADNRPRPTCIWTPFGWVC